MVPVTSFPIFSNQLTPTWSEVKWSHSVVSNSLWPPWTVAYQAPQSVEFSRQEYWSGLPFPSPGDLPNPGIEPKSPALQADTLPSEPPGKPAWNSYLPWFKNCFLSEAVSSPLWLSFCSVCSLCAFLFSLFSPITLIDLVVGPLLDYFIIFSSRLSFLFSAVCAAPHL